MNPSLIVFASIACSGIYQSPHVCWRSHWTDRAECNWWTRQLFVWGMLSISFSFLHALSINLIMSSVDNWYSSKLTRTCFSGTTSWKLFLDCEWWKRLQCQQYTISYRIPSYALFLLFFQFSVSCQLLLRILTSTIALVPAVRVINESCGVDGLAQFSVSGGTGVGYYINVCTPILIMFSTDTFRCSLMGVYWMRQIGIAPVLCPEPTCFL